MGDKSRRASMGEWVGMTGTWTPFPSVCKRRQDSK